MQHAERGARPTASRPIVDCESPEVAALLTEITRLVLTAGGYLSDQLTINERDGALSVHLTTDETTTSQATNAQRPKLVVLPDDAMPEVSRGKWEWRGEALTVRVPPQHPSTARDLLELHASLYTATQKKRWFQTVNPKGTVAADSPTLAAIQSLRPGFQIDPSPSGFLATRTFRRRGDWQPSLMPIADAFNHHPQGAPLAYKEGRLKVRSHQPAGTSEAFVNYGSRRRDPLALALHYGYADPLVRVAASAPLLLEVAGIGAVEVPRHDPPATSKIDPPNVHRTKDGLRLSHLTFQAEQPERLLVPLTMVATASGVADPERTAREMVGSVIDGNLALLAGLEATLDKSSPMGSMLTEACGYQAQVFRSVGAAIT